MFYYSRHVVCTRSITRFIDPDQEVIYQVPVCVLRHLFPNVEFYYVQIGYGLMESSQFCLKPDERVNVKWQYSQLNLHFVYNFSELHLIISREQIDKHSINELS